MSLKAFFSEKDIVLGFTGAREGITEQQRTVVSKLLIWLPVETVVHGDCVGADHTFDVMAWSCGLHRILFPSNLEALRAHGEKLGSGSFSLNEPQNPLIRNKSIIDNCTHLLACPEKIEEEKRSGTWSTIRNARKSKRKCMIIFPDGKFRLENEEPVPT